MASTRLVRKALRNRTKSKKRVSAIKRLTSKPVLKNVDIEQIKEEFANKKTKPAVKKETPAKEVIETTKAEVKEEKPKAKEEKKAAPKKAMPKAKKEAAPKAKKKEDSAE